MALSLVSSGGGTPVLPDPDSRLQAALADFKDALTAQQRGHFQAHQTAPGLDAVLKLTAEVDAQQAQARQRCIGTRLQYFLESVQQFSGIVDTFASSNPSTAALVWGTVKFAILVAMKVSPYLQSLTKLFIDLKDSYPRLSAYLSLYKDFPRVQNALCNFYAEIVSTCKHIILINNQKGFLDLVKFTVLPFQTEFSGIRNGLMRCSKEVEHEIGLATIQSMRRDQELQSLERHAASNFRNAGRRFFQRSIRENESLRELQIAKDARQAAARKVALLNKLSSHNPAIDYKRARIKQKGDTTGWVLETQEFIEWIEDHGPSVLWFSGKLGTGKTVATANVVNYIRAKSASSVCSTFYFFCRFDNEMTLTAVEIFRSLLRQYFDAMDFSSKVETRLNDLLRYSAIELEDLIECYEELITGPLTLVVDGVDECLEPEQALVLRCVRALHSISGVKVFLSTRDSMRPGLEKLSINFHEISTASAIVRPCIKTYIDICVDEAYRSRNLVVKDENLLETIKDTLKEKAKGMFLWVAFQIEDICGQTNDTGILEALENLPKDLPETYARITTRIIQSRQAELMAKILEWVIIAKEPLSLGQLRQAIAIEPCQPHTIPDRLSEDLDRIIGWSKSLLILDDEDYTVQFTHPSVRALAKGHRKGNDILPETIVNQLLENETKKPVAQLARKLWRIKSSSDSQNKESVTRVLYETSRQINPSNKTGGQDHPFIRYVSRFWLVHTRDLRESDQTFRLWLKLLRHPSSFAEYPWTVSELEHRDSKVFEYIYEQNHLTLLQYLMTSYPFLSESEHKRLLLGCLERKRLKLLKILLRAEDDDSLDDALTPYMVQAVQRGNAQITESLLTFGLSPNITVRREFLRINIASSGNMTHAPTSCVEDQEFVSLFEIAIEMGQYHIALLLIEAGVDFQTWDSRLETRTDLMMAVKSGAVEIIESLLARGAPIGGPQSVDGTTPLMAAILKHDTAVARLLIKAGASVDGRQGHLLLDCIFVNVTPLFASINEGLRDICVELLKANAATEVCNHGLSPLSLAVTHWHEFPDFVNILFEAGADVNYPFNFEGVPPLILATAKGNLEAATKLIAAGANVNQQGHVEALNCAAFDREEYGITALHIASALAQQSIVEYLIEIGADTGIGTSRRRNAFDLAVIGNHPGLVQALLKAGKPAQDAAARALACAVRENDHEKAQWPLSCGVREDWVIPETFMAFQQPFDNAYDGAMNGEYTDGLRALRYALRVRNDDSL